MEIQVIPTHSESVTAFDSIVRNFKDSKESSADDLFNAVIGIDKSIQIRDYALGATCLELIAEDSVKFISSLLAIRESAGAYCLLAVAEMRNKNLKSAHESLNKAKEINANYSLTALLMRVMLAGWPVEGFITMAENLHPKVSDGIVTDYATKLVTE